LRLRGVLMKSRPYLLLLLLTLLALSANANYVKEFEKELSDCEPQRGGNDYRRNDPEIRHLKSLVEGAHFTDGVRRGLYGNAGSLESDLNYVLNKFPNHPQALMVMAKRWSSPDFKQLRRADRKDYKWSTKECYFIHALQFAGDDPQVHSVMAIFYHQQKDYKWASHFYLNSVKLGPNNPEAQYNLGLFYMDTKDFPKALQQAYIAEKLGYPLSGLKDRLVRENAWKEE
jgi:tetratricopeptide (TPR) repeat protein